MVLFIKNVDFPLHVKQCSGRVCPLRVQLKRVRIPIALRGLLSSLQTNAGSYSCAGYSGGVKPRFLPRCINVYDVNIILNHDKELKGKALSLIDVWFLC